MYCIKMIQKIILAVFMLCVGMTMGCTISGYVDMKMMERLVQSTYVVYGRTTWHTPTRTVIDGRTQYVIDATFEVHCIFKEGEDPMNEEITISQISPEVNCSGTDATQNLKVGDYAIVALKNTTGGKYILEEVMPEMSATFFPTKPYIFSLANICTMQKWKAPVGATSNRCPICGISDFSPEVTTLDNTSGNIVNCEFTTNGLVSNMTACDLYVAGSITYANSQSCVPASYNQTCVSLLYRASSAVCDCSPKTNNNNLGTADGQTLLPNKFIVVVLLMFLLGF